MGASFAPGFVTGLPTSVTTAQSRTDTGILLKIGRQDSLTSIEAALQKNFCLGAILENFGPNSHQHWLCAYYDVPTLSLCVDAFLNVPNSICSIDFNAATIFQLSENGIRPPANRPTLHSKVPSAAKEPARSTIRILAQLNSAADVKIALNQRCDGFGEIKSSIKDFGAGKPINAAVEILHNINQLSGKKRIIPVRFFDASPYHYSSVDTVDGTAISAFGVRGARLIVREDDTVELFLKSMIGAKDIDYTVVLPMVNLKSELEVAAHALSMPMDRIGVQFETPMACLNADELLSGIGFAIIGLNDLTQYTTAWDRNLFHNAFTPASSLVPAVVSLAEMVCAAARRNGVPSAVAVDLYPTASLVADLRRISPDSIVVSPRRIKLWRHHLESG